MNRTIINFAIYKSWDNTLWDFVSLKVTLGLEHLVSLKEI